MEVRNITLEQVRSQIIGRDHFITTPFGKRLLVYADYTASGRAVKFIEDYMQSLLNIYANTHTEDDFTGRIMTELLHEAKLIIKRAHGAEDCCYFIATGTGSTGAIIRFQEIIGVALPPATKKRLKELVENFGSLEEAKKHLVSELEEHLLKNRPIVFVGPYEHHSNEVMWRESFCEVIEIELTPDGQLDLEDLERKVSDPRYEGRFKIGSFSAASNVTGIKTPIYEVAKILHRHGAIACFDLAAIAPYEKIEMNKDDESYLDAVFVSAHKFLGGPGSTGFLIINKKLYDARLPPTHGAGGTVDYVSAFAHDFMKDVEAREMPGTPGILQIIKAALSISLRDALGTEDIARTELSFIRRAIDRLGSHPNIVILGNKDPEKRIAILSFLIRHGKGYLHPRFVTRLLNDLFGIQSRAGCSCAGPYGHRLLGIDRDTSLKMRKAIQKGYASIKPGWTRVNFHYTITEEEFDYICKAIEFVADYGQLFLSLYVFDPKSGDWRHQLFDEMQFKPTLDLATMAAERMKVEEAEPLTETKRSELFEQYLNEARNLAEQLTERSEKMKEESLRISDPEVDELRYFEFRIQA